jgi:hypothetical protein
MLHLESVEGGFFFFFFFSGQKEGGGGVVGRTSILNYNFDVEFQELYIDRYHY